MTIKRSDKVEVRSLAAYYSQLDDLLNKQQVHVEPSIISARLSSDNNTILSGFIYNRFVGGLINQGA